jgi:hypothetical protein
MRRPAGRRPTRRRRLFGPAATLLPLVALLTAGCATSDHLAVAHRHSPGSEARIVILPITLPSDRKAADGEGASLAALYATELLRSYEVLEYERFRRSLERRGLTLDNVLVDGDGVEVVDALGVDGVLLGEVYTWVPGKPGFWFLAKKGRVGFQARLVDLRTGSMIWSVNRVRETRPDESLAVGLAEVFAELGEEIPTSLTPY